MTNTAQRRVCCMVCVLVIVVDFYRRYVHCVVRSFIQRLELCANRASRNSNVDILKL